MEKFGFKNLVLASGADGVGTKVIIAQMMGKHDTVGIDLVAMNADDIVTSGVSPSFLSGLHSRRQTYILNLVEEIVSGVVEGCIRAGCALLYGETAQMP